MEDKFFRLMLCKRILTSFLIGYLMTYIFAFVRFHCGYMKEVQSICKWIMIHSSFFWSEADQSDWPPSERKSFHSEGIVLSIWFTQLSCSLDGASSIRITIKIFVKFLKDHLNVCSFVIVCHSESVLLYSFPDEMFTAISPTTSSSIMKRHKNTI